MRKAEDKMFVKGALEQVFSVPPSDFIKNVGLWP